MYFLIIIIISFYVLNHIPKFGTTYVFGFLSWRQDRLNGLKISRFSEMEVIWKEVSREWIVMEM